MLNSHVENETMEKLLGEKAVKKNWSLDSKVCV